jgi:hypothetical protein
MRTRTLKTSILALLASLFSSGTWAGSADYCSLPGEMVVEGTTGGFVVRVGPSDAGVFNPLPGQQIEAIYWAEPASFADQIVVTMKIDSLAPYQPLSQEPAPETLYQVFFELADKSRYYLLYDPAATAGLQFTYGLNASLNQSDSVDTEFGYADEQSRADSDGTIQWALSRAKVPALSFSSRADGIYGLVKMTNPGGGYRGVNATRDGVYQLRGNASCAGSRSQDTFGGAGGAGLWLVTVAFALVRLARSARRPLSSAYLA